MDEKTKPKSLLEWEQSLTSRFNEVELLGEIMLTSEETKQLGQMFGELIGRKPVEQVISTIEQFYPRTFAMFLVAQGMYHYAGREGFWPSVSEAIGKSLDNFWTGEFGKLFERILKKYRLPLFPDTEGHRFVAPILLHGGIPTYSLNDFFEKMLHPIDRYTDMATQEIIGEWLLRPDTLVDKPVWRFLKFGGAVAEDFVKRCGELDQEFLETHRVPQAETVGLPLHIVEAFCQWIEDRHISPESSGSGLRWHRPQILLDFNEDSLTLYLPPQQFPLNLARAELLLEIKADNVPIKTINLEGYAVGGEFQTLEQTILLEMATVYEVAFKIDGQQKKVWPYQGFDAQRPLLIFDPRRGDLLPYKQTIPKQLLWLLYPDKATLNFKGTADLMRELPSLYGQKGQFRCEEWDLSQAAELTLRWDTKSWAIPIIQDESSKRPHLVGGIFFEEAYPPLYHGSPPTVRIQLVGRTSPQLELPRWQIAIRSQGMTAPQFNIFNWQPLAKFANQLIYGNGQVELPLSMPQLLGHAPIGTYEVRLRGPLGRDADFTFRIVPHLAVKGHAEIYLPNPVIGATALPLQVELDSTTTLENQRDKMACQINKITSNSYQVIVPPEAHSAALAIVHPTLNVQVPLIIPLRRLSWAVELDGESATQKWATQIIKYPLDALLQAKSPSLEVRLGEYRFQSFASLKSLPLSLHLIDVNGIELQRSEPATTWKFNLMAFLDTIRQSDSPTVQFELRGLQTALPILQVTRALNIQQITVKSKFTDKVIKIKLAWQEPVRLRNRRVRFWPLWQAWHVPYERAIPDEAVGEFTFDIPIKDFSEQAYLVEFLVVDPWGEVPTPMRPPLAKDKENITTIELADPFKRKKRLKNEVRKTIHFKLLLELACLEWWIGQRTRLGHTFFKPTEQPNIFSTFFEGYLYQCCERLEKRKKKATVQQLLVLIDLIKQSGDKVSTYTFLGDKSKKSKTKVRKTTQNSFDSIANNPNNSLLIMVRQQMSALSYIQKILDRQVRGKVSPSDFKAYFDYLLPSGFLSPEIHHTLLTIADEELKIYVINQLIEQNKVGSMLDLMPLDFCTAILNIPHKNISACALRELIKRASPVGIEKIVTDLRNSVLSTQEAIDFLQLNVNFATIYLEAHLNSLEAVELLVELNNKSPFVELKGWLMTVPHQKARIYGLIQLLKQDFPLAIEKILGELPAVTMSEDNVVNLLKLNLDAAVAYLKQHLSDPFALRLLEKLIPNNMPIIKVKYWIYSPAGWAQIDKIERGDGQFAEYFMEDEVDIRLHVTIRPGYDAERAIIEIASLRFVKSVPKRYQCAKENCCFVTPERDLLENKHNRAAHGGLSPQFRPYMEGTLRFYNSARYCSVVVNSLVGLEQRIKN